MAAPGAMPLSIKPATSGRAALPLRKLGMPASDREEAAVTDDAGNQVVRDVCHHQALRCKGKGQPFAEEERPTRVRPDGVAHAGSCQYRQTTAFGLQIFDPAQPPLSTSSRSCAREA